MELGIHSEVECILGASFFRYQLPLYLYIGGIFLLSSIPGGSMPSVDTILPADKVAHFVEYAVLGFLLFRAIFSVGRVPVKWLALLVILCTAALGALDEFYQNLTGRDSDIYDWILDCLGATIASMCCLAFYIRVQENVRAKKARKSHS